MRWQVSLWCGARVAAGVPEMWGASCPCTSNHESSQTREIGNVMFILLQHLQHTQDEHRKEGSVRADHQL